MPNESERSRFRQRIAALRNLPRVMVLVWQAAPLVVLTSLLLRLLVAVAPLGVLAVSKRLIDAVVNNVKHPGTASHHEIWILLGLEFLFAAGGLTLGRAIDYCDARLADEFGRSVGMRLMKHAANMDLTQFEDPSFYDKLERARVQSTDRVSLLHSLGTLFQRLIALG